MPRKSELMVDKSADVANVQVGDGEIGRRSRVHGVRAWLLTVGENADVDSVIAPGMEIHVEDGGRLINANFAAPTEEQPIGGFIVVGRAATVRNVSAAYGQSSAEQSLRSSLRVSEKSDIQDVVLRDGHLETSHSVIARDVIFRQRTELLLGDAASVYHLRVGSVGGGYQAPVRIGEGAFIHDAEIVPGTRVGTRTRIGGHDALDLEDLEHLWGKGDFGTVSIAQDASIGDNVTVDRGASIGRGARIGNGCKLGEKVAVRLSADIRDNCIISERADIDQGVILEPEVRVGYAAVVGYATGVDRATHIGANVKIAENVDIGANVFIAQMTTVGRNSKIGDRVRIGHSTKIGSYVAIEPGVVIGDNVTIANSMRVSRDVADGESVVAAALAAGDTLIEVNADAESWILSRVADVMESSGQKRLDKRALTKTMPTLVDTYCVKQLLRMAPPPSVAQLREMAAAFSCTPKMDAEAQRKPPVLDMSVRPQDWASMQIIGSQPNDVILYRVADATLHSFISENERINFESGRTTIRMAVLMSLMQLGKGEDHPGGTFWRYLGWARFTTYDTQRALLLEEIQTDLVALAFNLAEELATFLWIAGSDRAPDDIEHHAWKKGLERLANSRESPESPDFMRPDASKNALGVLAGVILHDAERHFSYSDMMEPAKRRSEYHESVWYWRHAIKGAASLAIGDAPPPREAHEWSEDVRSILDMTLSMIEQFRGTFEDWYESALAGVLIFAREHGLSEVWVPDYETKYAVAAYGSEDGGESLAPPRSVYTDLPKRFQVSPVQPLPSYMDTSGWDSDAEARRDKPWVKVKIPDRPRGRRLLANRQWRP